VLQKLLRMVCEQKKKTNLTDSSNEKLFLLTLLNSSITEFGHSMVKRFLSTTMEGILILGHLLKECPNLKKISISQSMWNGFAILPGLVNDDILYLMATKWSNLIFLSMKSSDIKLKKSSLTLIQQNFLRLRWDFYFYQNWLFYFNNL